MDFYTSISKYYDYIFPYQPNQKSFVESYASHGSKILDVGCGSGDLAIQLQKSGYNVTAIDADKQMIEQAKSKIKSSTEPIFLEMNMLDIVSNLKTKFDVIYCFGNTLVHLNSMRQVEDFIKSCYNLLNEDGVLLIQILNYRNIIVNNITSLPLIDNDMVKFERFYESLGSTLIDFITKLTIKNTNETVENRMQLYPLSDVVLSRIISSVGFHNTESYGNFKKELYLPQSLPFIIKSIKKVKRETENDKDFRSYGYHQYYGEDRF